MPKHNHHPSPWKPILTFDIPGRTAQPFRVHAENISITDGGISRGGLKDQISAVLATRGKATIMCCHTFVKLILKERLTLTAEHMKRIGIHNKSKLEEAIKTHRAAANGRPSDRQRLDDLAALLQHLP